MKQGLLLIFVVILLLNLCFAWEPLFNAPMLLRFEDGSWKATESNLKEILQTSPFSSIKNYAISLNTEETNAFPGNSDLYRLHILDYNNIYYPLLVDKNGNIIKDQEMLLTIFAALTETRFLEDDVISYYKNINTIADSLSSKLRFFTLKDRKRLASEALEFLNRLGKQEYDIDRFLEKALENKTPYYELALYDTANVLKSELTKMSELSIEYYNRYKKYPSDSILAFNSARWLYSANSEINNIYNRFPSLSKNDLEKSLIELYREFISRKKVQSNDQLVEEPSGMLEMFKTSFEVGALAKMNKLLGRELPEVIPEKLPPFITVPVAGSVITIPPSSKVTINWHYTLPYRVQPLFYISYGKAGEGAQSISTKSNTLTLQTAPFSKYIITLRTQERALPYEISFSTLLGELPAPEVSAEIKVFKEAGKNVMISWTPPIEGRAFEYRVVIRETEFEYFTSTENISLDLEEFKRYTLEITPVKIDGFTIPQNLRKTAVTKVEVLPEYPVSSTTPEKAKRGEFKFTWETKNSQNVDHYVFLIFKDPDGKEKLVEEKTEVNEFPFNLEPHKNYYWTVDIVYKNGEKISNIDSENQRILWSLEVTNAKPSIKIFPMKGTILATRTIFPIELSVYDDDGDRLTVGYEKSLDGSFEKPVIGDKRNISGQGTLTFDVQVAEAESFFVRGFVSDGYEKVFSNPVSLSMQYQWEAEPDGITTDSTAVRLSWQLKEPSFPIEKYRILLSWEIQKEIVSEGRVDVRTETKLYESDKNSLTVELKPHTLYTWQVTSILKDGSEGPHSSPLTFRTPNSKPFAQLFLNDNPFVENAVVNIDEDVISWKIGDPDGDKVNVSYELLDENGVLFKASPVVNKIELSKIPKIYGNKNYTLRLILNDGIDPEFGSGEFTIEKRFRTNNRVPRVSISKPDDVQDPDQVLFTVLASDPDSDELTVHIKIDNIPIGDKPIDHKASETINLYELLQEKSDEIRSHLWNTEKIYIKNGTLLLKGHTEYNLEVTIFDAYGGKDTAVTILSVNNRNPQKPKILVPENDSIHELDKEMQWHSEDYDGDEMWYEIIVRDAETGETIVSTSTTSNSWAMDRVLIGNKRYLVKVIARDPYGGKSESDWISFYAPNRTPEITSFRVSPIGHETLDASISWSAMDLDNERVSTALTIKNKAGKIVYSDGNLSSTGSKIISLPGYGSYSAILKATDENKGVTEASTTFVIPNRSPEPSNPSTPVELWFEKEDGKYTLYASTTFIDPDMDYLNLRVTLFKISTQGGEIKTAYEKLSGPSTLTELIVFKGLDGHTKYRLFLEVHDQPLELEVSSKSLEIPINFETPNVAPLITLLEPIASAEGVAYKPALFKWDSFDYEGDKIHFTLEITEKETGETTLLATDEFSAKVKLKPHTTYLWDIKANDDFGGTFQSDVREFTTLNNPPMIIVDKPEFKPEKVYPIFKVHATDVDGDKVDLLVSIKDASTLETVFATTTITESIFEAISGDFTGNHGYIAEFTAIEKETPPELRKSYSKTISFITPNRSPKIDELRINGKNAVDSLVVNKKGIRLSWKATDPDGEQLSYKITLILIDGKNEIKLAEINNQRKNYYHFDKALKGHAKYKLILEALDEHGGVATKTVFFETENTPPEILSIVSPKETREPTQTVFSWSAYDDDEDLLSYVLSIWSEDGSYSRTIEIKKGVTSHRVAEGLPGHKKYQWNVTAYDNHGGIAISDPVSFETANNPPKVVPFFPENGAQGLPDTIEFHWKAFDEDHDELSYVFHLLKAGETVYTINTGESTSVQIPRLKGNTEYCWYIEASDGHTDQPVTSQRYYFRVNNHIPLIRLIIPEEPIDPDFAVINWSAFDLDGDTLLGKLRILNTDGTDAVEPIMLDTKASSTVYIEGLIGNKNYIASIFVEDWHGGAATDTRSFQTSNRAPYIPEPASPGNFAVIDTDFRNFFWSSDDPDGDVLSHDIFLECLTGDDVLEIFDTTANKFKISFLRPYSIYRWKITVRDNHGGVTEGPYWYFITNPSADKGFEPYFTSMVAQKVFKEMLIFAGTLKGELLIFNGGKQIDREKLSKYSIVELSAPKYSDLLKPEEVNHIKNAVGRFFSTDTWPLILAKDEKGNSYKIVVTDTKELSLGKNIFIFPVQ
ncbi:hypothetical protein AT15_07620 [Kosmotoga arenicorallina S304]|uniref:Fibronectin type-III domain-containing protein n=1 Tax=Kosmotoga arenicorallina S304 TaxID=1453497 RepID=A0A176K2B9_9BACT|nr:hypothetical protein [Kosmotoga arenicorallina]OAA31356.1 hypothetical protein AT15_07620 [Kosmotoga arenicorallina S304]